MRNYDNDYLKVKYTGSYYSVRLKKGKIYLAERDTVFGLLRLTDELGEENTFEPEEFEVVKVLKNGISVFSQTNRQFISLKKGTNLIFIKGMSENIGYSVEFVTKFYYL